MLFDELTWFNMSLIWSQEEEVTQGEQSKTKNFGHPGDRGGDSLGLGTKRQFKVRGIWNNSV